VKAALEIFFGGAKAPSVSRRFRAYSSERFPGHATTARNGYAMLLLIVIAIVAAMTAG